MEAFYCYRGSGRGCCVRHIYRIRGLPGVKIEKLWAVFRDNAAFIAGTMFIMCPAKATGSVFAYLNINQTIADFMFSISSNYYVVMFMIFVIMFIVGMFIQTTPAIIILAPHPFICGNPGGMRPDSLWHHP